MEAYEAEEHVIKIDNLAPKNNFLDKEVMAVIKKTEKEMQSKKNGRNIAK